jgi:hypothetical protein
MASPLAVAAIGIYVANVNAAPGAAVIAFLLMYMRDLACCAGGMAFYSTPSDLVRLGLAHGVSINGELAGGMVMSLMTLRDSRIVVAVLSSIAHANTSALALKIGDAFAKEAR